MKYIKSIAVFCSASMGANEIYAQAARNFGKILAGRGIELVYGGSKDGLMGVLADSTLAHGGKVAGVLPRFLADKKEIAHKGLSRLFYVETLSERKQMLSELAQASVVLPGGFGTMDEMFEMLTWSQLQLHDHRVGVLNVNHLFTPLEELFQRMSQEKLLHHKNNGLYIFSEDPDDLLNRLEEMTAKKVQSQ